MMTNAVSSGTVTDGQRQSASGAEDDSPPLQRWVGMQLESESLGDGTDFRRRQPSCAVPKTPDHLHHAAPRLPRDERSVFTADYVEGADSFGQRIQAS